MREYVYGDLVELSKYLDLEILQLRGRDHMLDKVPKGLLQLYLGVTSVFPRWKDSWSLVAKKKKNWSPAREPRN